jgi:hypothetical protein
MGEYAEYQLAQDMRRMPRNFRLPPVPHWPKVECPVCGKPCGGRGDRQNDGVHAHMKFKHGIKQKWKRVEMLAAQKEGQGDG